MPGPGGAAARRQRGGHARSAMADAAAVLVGSTGLARSLQRLHCPYKGAFTAARGAANSAAAAAAHAAAVQLRSLKHGEPGSLAAAHSSLLELLTHWQHGCNWGSVELLLDARAEAEAPPWLTPVLRRLLTSPQALHEADS